MNGFKQQRAGTDTSLRRRGRRSRRPSGVTVTFGTPDFLPHHLQGQFPIIVRPIAVGIIDGDRLQMKGRFGQADIFPNHRGANFSFKAGPELLQNFLRVLRPVIDAASEEFL